MEQIEKKSKKFCQDIMHSWSDPNLCTTCD
jgi:hypothetical protein